MWQRQLIPLLLLLLLTSCVQQQGRYRHRHDSAPLRPPTAEELRDAIPRAEAPQPKSLRPYSVNGRHYQPLADPSGFVQYGIASWYGRKFHGHLTAIGEIYNMFAMTAAHKTLPLPSYVRVTNLDNGKSVIVRVNDRGPFHDNRIIDLSYSAAYKLDMLKTGTARVRLEYLTVTETPAVPLAETHDYYIQVLAGRQKARMEQVGQGLALLHNVGHKLTREGELYKLQLGPFASEDLARQALLQLQRQGYKGAYLINPAI